MSGFLLDVNVLVALMWPTHESHAEVQDWFARHSSQGWATCPFTQAAFVRIISNPAFSPDAVAPPEALQLLSVNLRHRSHRFWSDDLSLTEALEHFGNRLVGHHQVTDAYLLGLAIHKRGKLATLDRGIQALLVSNRSDRPFVEMI